eukprot:TRINITY_DN7248_c0_g1_i1.p1 TRINITY_DN7248_c0_g1~~TRINITY_DN7248_c0_g1_i1.p1  ORF type:complete len:736 (-),score=196.78 TRINITY_DN7248_c0_g1_i1:1-2208(-)
MRACKTPPVQSWASRSYDLARSIAARRQTLAGRGDSGARRARRQVTAGGVASVASRVLPAGGSAPNLWSASDALRTISAALPRRVVEAPQEVRAALQRVDQYLNTSSSPGSLGGVGSPAVSKRRKAQELLLLSRSVSLHARTGDIGEAQHALERWWSSYGVVSVLRESDRRKDDREGAVQREAARKQAKSERKGRSAAPSGAVPPKLVALPWALMLRSLKGHPGEAISLYERMKEKGVVLSAPWMYSELIKTSKDNLSIACRFLGLMQVAGVTPTRGTFDTLLESCKHHFEDRDDRVGSKSEAARGYDASAMDEILSTSATHPNLSSPLLMKLGKEDTPASRMLAQLLARADAGELTSFSFASAVLQCMKGLAVHPSGNTGTILMRHYAKTRAHLERFVNFLLLRAHGKDHPPASRTFTDLAGQSHFRGELLRAQLKLGLIGTAFQGVCGFESHVQDLHLPREPAIKALQHLRALSDRLYASVGYSECALEACARHGLDDAAMLQRHLMLTYYHSPRCSVRRALLRVLVTKMRIEVLGDSPPRLFLAPSDMPPPECWPGLESHEEANRAIAMPPLTLQQHMRRIAGVLLDIERMPQHARGGGSYKALLEDTLVAALAVKDIDRVISCLHAALTVGLSKAQKIRVIQAMRTTSGVECAEFAAKLLFPDGDEDLSGTALPHAYTSEHWLSRLTSRVNDLLGFLPDQSRISSRIDGPRMRVLKDEQLHSGLRALLLDV